MAPRVAIVDYGVGNLFSILHACRTVGLEGWLAAEGDSFDNADAVILPGVGAFASAMDRLKQTGLAGTIKDWSAAGKPTIGICLGLQLFLSESFEHGHHTGLGLIDGSVRGLREAHPDRSIRVPNVGWRPIFRHHNSERRQPDQATAVFDGVADGSEFYFVHSYYTDVRDEAAIQFTSRFEDLQFCCAIAKGNIIGFQFHPERSSQQGLAIFANIKQMLETAS